MFIIHPHVFIAFVGNEVTAHENRGENGKKEIGNREGTALGQTTIFP
jgi:hypothetical protein